MAAGHMSENALLRCESKVSCPRTHIITVRLNPEPLNPASNIRPLAHYTIIKVVYAFPVNVSLYFMRQQHNFISTIRHDNYLDSFTFSVILG